MDISDEESIGDLLLYIDNTIQYGEDLDVKVPRVSHSSASLYKVYYCVYPLSHDTPKLWQEYEDYDDTWTAHKKKNNFQQPHNAPKKLISFCNKIEMIVGGYCS